MICVARMMLVHSPLVWKGTISGISMACILGDVHVGYSISIASGLILTRAVRSVSRVGLLGDVHVGCKIGTIASGLNKYI